MLLINSAVRNLKAQVEIRKAKAGTYKAKESLLSEVTIWLSELP